MCMLVYMRYYEDNALFYVGSLYFWVGVYQRLMYIRNILEFCVCFRDKVFLLRVEVRNFLIKHAFLDEYDTRYSSGCIIRQIQDMSGALLSKNFVSYVPFSS